MSLIEYLQATAPSMARDLTLERLSFMRHITALTARVAELEKALKAIRDYDRPEVVKDEFAYDRLQEAYRDCARAALDVDKELER